MFQGHSLLQNWVLVGFDDAPSWCQENTYRNSTCKESNMIEVLKIGLEVRESKIFYAELTVAHVDASFFFS